MYLFQNIPIFLSSSFFKKIDSIILPFIWGYKTHRISKAHLQKPKKHGGLALPNFQHYYWATNARALIFWQDLLPQHREHCDTPKWLQLESHAARNSSLSALLFCTKDYPLSSVEDSFVLYNSIKILKQIRKVLQLPDFSKYSPICFNHCFVPAKSDQAFVFWRQRGLVTFSDLYMHNHLASFNELKESFSLPQSHFFRYLQVRHFVKENVNNYINPSMEHSFFAIMKLKPGSKHLVSKFVSLFSKVSVLSTNHIKSAWEADLGTELSDEVWREGLEKIHLGSNNARLQLIQYKIMHRLHFSKVKL